MKCILHIGTPKTATKSIQSFLESNRVQLKQQGFAYLRRQEDFSSFYRFVMLAYPLGRRDRYTLLEHIKTDEEMKSFQRKVFAQVKDELRHTVEGRKDLSVIISSELIQSQLVSAQEVLHLKEILQALGFDEFRLVVYLRNQPEFVNSIFSTFIKMGAIVEQPISPDHPDAVLCDHRKTIERFSAVFGESAIIPRLFHKARLKDGCIIHDFCSAVGISLDASFTMLGRENESLSNLGVALLRRLNTQVPSFNEKGVNPLRGNIVNVLCARFAESKYAMPTEIAEWYRTAFAASNEWVRLHFFPELPSLYPEDPLPKGIPVSATEAELDAVAGFMGDVWIKFARCRLENKQLLQVNRRRLRLVKGLIGLSVFLALACAAFLVWGH